ncbi:oleate hydratase, partial [Enterococcus faecium]|nr:oleate hydratase [Enterococcus faecium]
KLIAMPDSEEEKLDNITIEEYFKDDPHFFETNFWFMWETTFAFRTRSSAQELRRYMHQMIYEFTQIEHLVGVNRTRYNQYESIMLPLIEYLKEQGCKIILNRRVTDWEFKETPMQDEITVTGLKITNTLTQEEEYVVVDEDTAVIFTNGSITDSATLGDYETPAVENMDYGAASSLWKKASERFYNLGNPDKFFADRDASEWVSFTLTTKNHLLLNEITRITTQEPGNALNSFISTTPITPLGQKDVNMSIVVHHQPHFTSQKPNETVIWGYFLYPRRRGEFVDKQYIKMNGKEMLEELIGQLSKVDPGPVNIREKETEIFDSVINNIPVYMPYASALFNNRAKSDRPKVIPKHSTNLAFTGEFVEQPYQMIFTEQSAVRSGEIAAFHFAGIPMSRLVKTPRYDKDIPTLARAAKKMFE